MVRGLALALALAATHAFVPGTAPQLRQRAAPMSMSSTSASTTTKHADYLSEAGQLESQSPKKAPSPTADSSILVQGGSLRT